MDTPEYVPPKRRSYSKPIRIIAGVVAAALVVGISANGFIRVRITEGDEAATNYLVSNTDYVNKNTGERLGEKLQTLSQPVDLADYYRLASTQIAQAEYGEALENIEVCLTMDDGTDPELTQDLRMKKGCLQVLLEQYDGAMESLEQVIRQNPDYADVYLVKAQILAQQGGYEALADTLQRYLNIRPQDVSIRLVLAQTLFAMEKFKEAGEAYELLMENPETLEDPAQVRYLYALTQIQLGDFIGAEQNLLTAQEATPQADTPYYLGICRMSQEDYPGAVEGFTQAIEAGSMLQLSRYSRGVCGLVMEGYDLRTILEDLQAAAEYEGGDADESVSSQAQALLDQLSIIAEQVTLP